MGQVIDIRVALEKKKRIKPDTIAGAMLENEKMFKPILDDWLTKGNGRQADPYHPENIPE